MNPRSLQIEDCLMGCAIGDSLCLPYEGMSPQRVARLSVTPLEHRFLFGKVMVSDDTDHSIFVAQAIANFPDDPDRFAKALAWRLRFWLLCLPAGIGFATLRSIIKLWIGFPPSKSGVYSAGNGPAMRSAIIGVYFKDDPNRRRQYVEASTRITHKDPKAVYGAQAIANLAPDATNRREKPNLSELETVLSKSGNGQEWNEVVERIVGACKSGNIQDAITTGNEQKGVSGYVYHTVPVAIAGVV